MSRKNNVLPTFKTVSPALGFKRWGNSYFASKATDFFSLVYLWNNHGPQKMLAYPPPFFRSPYATALDKLKINATYFSPAKYRNDLRSKGIGANFDVQQHIF